MSVLIKGLQMPMPDRCWDCRFMDLQTGKCYADGMVRGTAKGYSRPADCPLLPIPDHGDLIDRDALLVHEFERNGITLMIVNRPGKKVPVLAVRFDDEIEMSEYVVAYFKDDITARWFAETFEEFMKA